MDPEAIGAVGAVPHGGSDDFDRLDFSANINPAIPAGVESVYADALDRSRRYPPDSYPEYRTAAGASVECEPERVIPTSGGLGAIRLAIEVCVEPGDEVLLPYPSFGEYAREVRLQGAEPRFVSHNAIFETDPTDCALVICCTPNNPTGDAIDPAALRAFARRCADDRTPVLVDEAFLGFTSRTSLAGTPNTIVARSLTKLFGLPGLRAGFAVATGTLRDRLAAAAPPWALGTPAARVGTHCLRDREFVRQTRERVARERAYLEASLPDPFESVPSEAPFVLCDVAATGLRPADLLGAVRERGIVLRDATTFRGLETHVRIAVRTEDDTDRLVAVLDDVLAGG